MSFLFTSPLLLGAVLSCIALAAADPAQDAASERAARNVGWSAGQRLPELVLPTLDGKRSVALSELRGRRLVLIQFASW